MKKATAIVASIAAVSLIGTLIGVDQIRKGNTIIEKQSEYNPTNVMGPSVNAELDAECERFFADAVQIFNDTNYTTESHAADDFALITGKKGVAISQEENKNIFYNGHTLYAQCAAPVSLQMSRDVSTDKATLFFNLEADQNNEVWIGTAPVEYVL